MNFNQPDILKTISAPNVWASSISELVIAEKGLDNQSISNLFNDCRVKMKHHKNAALTLYKRTILLFDDENADLVAIENQEVNKTILIKELPIYQLYNFVKAVDIALCATDKPGIYGTYYGSKVLVNELAQPFTHLENGRVLFTAMFVTEEFKNLKTKTKKFLDEFEQLWRSESMYNVKLYRLKNLANVIIDDMVVAADC